MSTWTIKTDPIPYETVELIISGIIPIFLIVFGTVGNFICIIVLLNKQNRKTSTNIYLIFLCLADTISLYQWNLSRAVDTYTNGKKQIWGQSLIMCKLSQFFSFYTLHTSGMFLTFVELDRACLLRSIWYKNKVARSKIALTFCIFILLILFSLDGFLFGLGFEYFTYNNSTVIMQKNITCYYSLNIKLNNFYAIQYPWIHLVIMYLLPFCVIVISTLCTIKKLTQRQNPINNHLARSIRRNRRISLMLLLLCLTYIICTLPNRLCFSMFRNQIIGHDYTDTIFFAANTLMYTRNAIDICFLYLSVHGFRQIMNKIFLNCSIHRQNQVNPSNNILTQHNGDTIRPIHLK